MSDEQRVAVFVAGLMIGAALAVLIGWGVSITLRIAGCA